MPIVITNTLTRSKVPLVPMEKGKIRMYVCGPTVYNLTHIGNARPVVFFDVVRRYLESSGGYQVQYASNFTDVDDKIINRAKDEGISSSEVSEKYIVEFNRDMENLGIRKPNDQPKVSEFIPQIIGLVEGLVENGAAYVVEDGEVFFSVRNFKEYGKLSGKNIDDLISGARVQPGELKRDPLDFSLWKPRKTADEPAWDSPWGKGRPGWHIECSAMALNILGDTFDIHGGGMDLIHPHHENEIAQSEAFTHKPFVRNWMHCNMLSMNSEKMSKSLGNILLTRDFINRYTAECLRFFLLSAHYRSTIDYSEKSVRDSQAALHRVYSTLKKCENLRAGNGGATSISEEEKTLNEMGNSFSTKWREAMDDDFNTAKSLGFVFEYVRAVNAYLDKKGFKPNRNSVAIAQQFLENIKILSEVLNLFGENSTHYLDALKESVLKEKKIDRRYISDQIQLRTDARKKKDFAKADQIRTELLGQGIELRDSTEGTDWDISFT